jgi:hypothetical protein
MSNKSSSNRGSDGSQNVSRPLIVQQSNYHALNTSQPVAQSSAQRPYNDNNNEHHRENIGEESLLLESANQQQVSNHWNARQTYITFLYLGFLALIPWCSK